MAAVPVELDAPVMDGNTLPVLTDDALEESEADAAASEESDADTDEAEMEDESEDNNDEGGVVTGTGMTTEPEVDALNEVMVGPSDDDGEVPVTARAVASVVEADSLDAVEDTEALSTTLLLAVALGTDESVVGARVASLPVADTFDADEVTEAVAGVEAVEASDTRDTEALESTLEASDAAD